MRVISPDHVDAAFSLAERIQREAVIFRLLVPLTTAPPAVPLAHREVFGEHVHFSFDHRMVDGGSALKLMIGTATAADWETRDRTPIAFSDPKSHRMPRRRARRLGRRIAWLLPRPATGSNEGADARGPLLLRVPTASLVGESSRSVTASIVGRLHQAALRTAAPASYSAVLVPLNARHPRDSTALGNYSSSELSIARRPDEVEAELDWFFARLGRSRAWSLLRLSRYGARSSFARWAIVSMARAFSLPKETAIVSSLRLDDEARARTGDEIFLAVPRRHPRTLSVGLVESAGTVYVCLGTAMDLRQSLESASEQIFVGVEFATDGMKEH